MRPNLINLRKKLGLMMTAVRRAKGYKTSPRVRQLKAQSMSIRQVRTSNQVSFRVQPSRLQGAQKPKTKV